MHVFAATVLVVMGREDDVLIPGRLGVLERLGEGVVEQVVAAHALADQSEEPSRFDSGLAFFFPPLLLFKNLVCTPENVSSDQVVPENDAGTSPEELRLHTKRGDGGFFFFDSGFIRRVLV